MEKQGVVNNRDDDGDDATVDHPMVSVPDALRTVLREAAMVAGRMQNEPRCEYRSVYDNEILGRQLAESIRMPWPGYPPYNASIMDGYCIRTKDNYLDNNNNNNTASGQELSSPTHVILGKVYAGDHGDDDDDDDDTTTVLLSSQQQSLTNLSPAIYVTTGAKVPDSYDRVVPVEDVRVSDCRRYLTVMASSSNAPSWIRPAGSDIAADSVVLPAGHVLDPVALGLLRQAACSRVPLLPQITIGILSTGNELLISSNNDAVTWNIQQHGQQGVIPDVNKPILLSLLSTPSFWSFTSTVTPNSFRVVDLGTCRDDDSSSLAECLKRAKQFCHVIITTGGISVGETDIMERVLIQHLGGTLHFGRLHMKPGKPTTFVTLPNTMLSSTTTTTNTTSASNCTDNPPDVASGPIDTTLVFALPGNPVSAYVCCHLLVMPCLKLLHKLLFCAGTATDDVGGASRLDSSKSLQDVVDNAEVQTEIRAKLAQSVALDVERPEYHRVILSPLHTTTTESPCWLATSTGNQRSSRLASLRDADGLLLLPQGTPQKMQALQGEEYTVLLLRQPASTSMTNNPTTVSTSQHLNIYATRPTVAPSIQQGKPKQPLRVAVVSLTSSPSVLQKEYLQSLTSRVEQALTGTKSGIAQAVCTETVSTIMADHQYASVDSTWKQVLDIMSKNQSDVVVDLLIVVTMVHNNNPNGKGLLKFHNQMAQYLHSTCIRVADAIAQQVRAGASSIDSTAAIWEVVVGFHHQPQQQQQQQQLLLVLFLSECGLEAALGYVWGLLKHALQMARGEVDRSNH